MAINVENIEKQSEFMTPDEFAELLQVSIGSVYKGIFPIKPIRIGAGKLIRFRRKDVEEYLAKL